MPDEPDPSQPGYAAPIPPAASPPTDPTATTPPAPGAAPTEPVQPAPPGWGAPPPPGSTDRPRRRRRWPWVLGFVLAAIVILAISDGVLFVQKVKPPIDAANEFLGEVEADNLDAAIALLCSEDENVDEDDLFLAAIASLDDYDVNPFGVDIDGDRATVKFDADGLDEDEVIELPLRKEDGDWRVCLSDIELR
ncbi:MAG: Rv0361 family membrane protein [Acidimicrobiia bacterium]